MMSKLNIAAQLYTVRDFCKDEESIKRTAEKISGIGYKYVQISAVAEIDNERMRRIMTTTALKSSPRTSALTAIGTISRR